MANFQKYINVASRSWDGSRVGTTLKRMVNQKEIIEYLKNNPGKTENQIMEEVYGYFRNESYISNKKYADCLRRALYSNKVSRVKAETSKGTRYIYFAV